MILSSYERKDSVWVYIQYARHPAEKKTLLRTKIRKDDPDKARKIQIAKNHLHTRMLTDQPQGESRSAGDSWLWVANWLRSCYRDGSTLETYLAGWKPLSAFMVEFGIRRPSDLTREHCADLYVPWRIAQRKRKASSNVSVNTALSELRLLGQIMDEAVARALVDSNPARKLKIRRDNPKVKPEMTAEEIAKIYRALESQPLWMQRSFHIALQTGLRFSETRILRHQVQLADGLIQIEEPKGGKKKAFSIPIYPAISGMIREFVKSGEPALWELPKPDLITGMAWANFFRAIGLPHLVLPLHAGDLHFPRSEGGSSRKRDDVDGEPF